jgi:acyl carrier protein
MKWIITIGLLGVVMLLVLLHDMFQKRSARKHMAGRPRRSAAEFGREFYPERAEAASEIRDILAKYIPVDLAQLEPSDQPVRDLHMDDLDSMATAEFIMTVEERFGIVVAEADMEKLRTFDDIVRYVIAKRDQKEMENKRGL